MNAFQQLQFNELPMYTPSHDCHPSTTLDEIAFNHPVQIFFELKHQGEIAITSLLEVKFL
jgi:hypothetical protein